jgi:ABC-type lipoprotein release transport system permease subunit
LRAGRLVAGRLPDVGPIDLPTFAAVAGVLLLTTFAAALIPARRASRLDPAAALRAET